MNESSFEGLCAEAVDKVHQLVGYLVHDKDNQSDYHGSYHDYQSRFE